MSEIRIFEMKPKYPLVGSSIGDVCIETFRETKPHNSQCFMFNNVLVIMAHKEDVMNLNILGEDFGIVKQNP